MASPPAVRLGALHGDLAGFLGFGARELDLEHAAAQCSSHAAALGGERQSDLADEASRLAAGPRTAQSQLVLLDLELDVLCRRSGQLRAEHRSVVLAPH